MIIIKIVRSARKKIGAKRPEKIGVLGAKKRVFSAFSYDFGGSEKIRLVFRKFA